MSKDSKLLQKAKTSPQNLKFTELQRLCEYFGCTKRKGEGSHCVYKRNDEPKFTISIQEAAGGMAKPYQVVQLLAKAEALDLCKRREK